MGAVTAMWDRPRGIFRIENHYVPKRGTFAIPWSVAVLDTAADRDLLQVGPGGPIPRVSARGAFRELIVRVFLPLLVAEPATSLWLEPAEVADGAAPAKFVTLRVELGCLLPDPGRGVGLQVGPESGLLVGLVEPSGKLVRNLERPGYVDCGPLTLPASWQGERIKVWGSVFDEFEWNPELPADLATATEKLTAPRETR